MPIVYETAKYDGEGTLSEHLVHWFRTDTRTGRLVWMIVSTLGAAALTKHILDFGNVMGRIKGNHG